MEKEFEKKELTKKSVNFSGWYNDVVLRADLADYAPVKGCMVFKPYGFAIWENIQKILDQKIKEAGVPNAYFPLFIPENFLKKEKEHIEGFSPELAVVTIGGGRKLKEKLVVRPTSETIMYEMFSRWIKSWRDLPFSVNQWCNVVRWEKRPRLFLRTTEFLWQEGHTVHRTQKEAEKEVKRALDVYIDLYREFFAIDGVFGEKSELEKFPGAKKTLTYEMLMPDGKALQGCTSHNLGQNFANVFNIRFQDKDGKMKIPWQTSWGFTTRSIGALIMVHGDDNGLIIPPKLAPIQIVVVPIFQGSQIDKKILKRVDDIKNILCDFKVEIDDRKEVSIGWKFNEWEIKGVPLRIEIGKKELEENKITIVRRDNWQKNLVDFQNIHNEIVAVLNSIQKDLFNKSKTFLKENIREVFTYDEFKNTAHYYKGFIKAFWCGDSRCEKNIKNETKATTRCLAGDSGRGKCIYCGRKATKKWFFAQAY
ncbi:MAG: proline--tRNA ligase [Candidatus Pacebacteria bacterium]|nr:proline--tRNA ligase [Candidatus Paceibacterota bacterium]